MPHTVHSNGTDRPEQGRGTAAHGPALAAVAGTLPSAACAEGPGGSSASPTSPEEREGRDGGGVLHRVTDGSARFVARSDGIGEEADGET
ncbi:MULTISPECIES: hypothetical protein [unclassified Streptomyces]|uniref:hypothetical protein n=1 Tax=unclassified Streptomyces TaxID=2593676 RepID=UPI00114CE7C5|nr:MULTISPECIES: hypothetical protein [unclassified Streptomyces]